MYLIQFCLQFFFINIHLFIQEIVIIKTTRLQAWAPAGGGGARVGRRPPPLQKKYKNFALLWAFLLLFLHMKAFLLRFSHFWGPFHHVGAFLLLLLHGGDLFWACPSTLRKFLWAPMIARRVREHAPGKYFCVAAI